jgi:hypothetical protein
MGQTMIIKGWCIPLLLQGEIHFSPCWILSIWTPIHPKELMTDAAGPLTTQFTWIANQIAQTGVKHRFLFIHVPAYNVFQVINGGAGTPFNALPIVRKITSWHIKSNRYFFTVVDIIGKQVKVTTFGGINGHYSPVDRSFIPTRASKAIDLLLSPGNVPW